jgi:predicted nucleic acid-binding protein
MTEAMQAVEAFQRMFNILEDGPAVWAQFRRLTRTISFGGKQVHDANLVASMLAHGQTRLLTFNSKHFRRFEPEIEIIEP